MDPGPQRFAEAGGPWGCPAPGLVVAGAEVQSLFCPDISRVSWLPRLTELYVPGGPRSAERGGHLPARGLDLC